ncbi:MAG: extracellular solute-binding protein [Alphaproteobacteria bacterium]|nr:extracellular solute-binding protein [Alphaproteobacteria bacterium]
MKRWVVALGVVAYVVVIVALFGYLWMTNKSPKLTVVSWPGQYGHAQASALLRPFADRSGVDVRIAEYDGGTAELARQVAAKKYSWDVIDMELPDAVTACARGLLEPIDASTLPMGPAGTPAAQDFLPGAIGPCWVGSVVYSQTIAYDRHRFAGEQPATLADFFNLKKFPGPRALHGTNPKFNLELALLADGVPPGKVYAVLSTPQGVARALAKLDTIRGALVWWTNDDSPVRMLADGRAAFSTILNGDIFNAAMHGRNLGVIWDRQLYEFDAFGVPKGDPKRGLATDFIRFATQAARLAGVSDWVPYGPARRSAAPYVGENPELNVAMTPFLPTSHFATAFAVDDEWWRQHGAAVDVLWQAWLAKEKQAR